VTTYSSHVKTNFYDQLAAGTYNRNGAGTLYDTASYINMIRTNRAAWGQANMAAWDIGMGLVGAAAIGAATSAWIAGAEAEINELDGNQYYDVIGLAGALYGLAYAQHDFDPTAGQHAAASNLADLAAILASYQINGGGFTWNRNYVSSGNETNQETVYAILALNAFDAYAHTTQYDGAIRGAADYLLSLQLGTGGWDNYSGDPNGENNELTGEALWAISTAYAYLYGPTAITLASFTAKATGSRISLAWSTGTETDNAGFNLYRATSAAGPYTRINARFIAANGDAVAGANYALSDQPGYGTFYYKLEDVDTKGIATAHGPVVVQTTAPLRRPGYRPLRAEQ
jgi:hypothetical protein